MVSNVVVHLGAGPDRNLVPVHQGAQRAHQADGGRGHQDLPEQAGGEFTKQMEAKEIMDLGLETLSPIQKSLILLKDYEGYSYEEMAEMTELTLSQVKVYLFRARKKMQLAINQLNKAV